MEDWQNTLKLVARATNEIHDVTKDIRKALKKNEEREAERVMKKNNEKKSSALLNALTAVGVVTAAVGIGYALYKYFMPDYLNEYSDDDYKDDFDDYFEDEDAPVEKTGDAEDAGAGDEKAESAAERTEAEGENAGADE